MRLIDADGFRNEINEYIYPIIGNNLIGGADVFYRVIHLLEDAPTIDPVIRCRDCAVPHNKWTGCPKLNGLVPPDDFYCAFGVRRKRND